MLSFDLIGRQPKAIFQPASGVQIWWSFYLNHLTTLPFFIYAILSLQVLLLPGMRMTVMPGEQKEEGIYSSKASIYI